MTNEKAEQEWLKQFLIVLGIVLLSLLVWILLVAIKVPYDTTEFYSEKEPYQDKEYYLEKEPYTVSYRECTKHSWLTGKCTEYDTFYKTEYRNVRKSRIVTKYRDVQKSRTITRYCKLWKRIAGWC